MSESSSRNLTHGCPFCSQVNPMGGVGELYMVQTLMDLHEQYVAVRAKQKLQNVVWAPLIRADPLYQVLCLLAVPELHLIWVVHKLQVAMETKVFANKDEGMEFMDNYLDMNNICRKSQMGGQSLGGNQTTKFLRLFYQLQVSYKEHAMLEAALPYIELLDLLPDYQEKIAEFYRLYKKLPISGTQW